MGVTNLLMWADSINIVLVLVHLSLATLYLVGGQYVKAFYWLCVAGVNFSVWLMK